jgi:hypothetical protein
MIRIATRDLRAGIIDSAVMLVVAALIFTATGMWLS